MYGSDTLESNGFVDMLDTFDYVKSSVVVSGHYSVSADGEADVKSGLEETMSFKNGADLVNRARAYSKQCSLALWVNDMAIPTEQRDAFQQHYTLPAHYADIARDHRLREQDICILFESALRKQAHGDLHALYKKIPALFERSPATEAQWVRCLGSVSEIGEAQSDAFSYMIRGPYREPIVVLDGNRPKHNLVLASLFFELKTRFAPEMIVTIFNESDEYRLNLGMHVAKKLYALNMPMMNVYCNADDLSMINFSNVPSRYRR